jgi:hypothetical protein
MNQPLWGRTDVAPHPDAGMGSARVVWIQSFSALATVILFVWLAKYYADRNDATQGAAIIGALAAVVAAFIGSRVLSEKRNIENSDDTDKSAGGGA